MNGVGRSRCYLSWIPYSYDDIIDNPWPFKIKKKVGGKRMSTFSSPRSVSGLRVCESVFKSCPLIQMTRPSDGTNFTQFMNLFTYTGVLTLFCRYTRAFCLDLFGSVMFPNNSADSVRQFICHSLTTCSTYPRRAMTGGRQYSLICTSTSLGHVSSRSIA
jgi:hypothetical protein